MRTLAGLYPAALLLAACSPSGGLAAPGLTATGTGTVAVPPTRARAAFSVVSRASTAGAAVAANSMATDKLLTGLRALPLTDSVHVLSVGVYPNEDDSGRLTDYRATTAVELLIRNVDSVGAVIDRAVSIGLTSVDRVVFEADSTTRARQQALARAFAMARSDAEALAKATGHNLGTLKSVSTGQDPWGGASSGFEEASITTGSSSAEYGNARSGVIRIGPAPRSIQVTASVTGRWAIRN